MSPWHGSIPSGPRPIDNFGYEPGRPNHHRTEPAHHLSSRGRHFHRQFHGQASHPHHHAQSRHPARSFAPNQTQPAPQRAAPSPAFSSPEFHRQAGALPNYAPPTDVLRGTRKTSMHNNAFQATDAFLNPKGAPKRPNLGSATRATSTDRATSPSTTALSFLDPEPKQLDKLAGSGALRPQSLQGKGDQATSPIELDDDTPETTKSSHTPSKPQFNSKAITTGKEKGNTQADNHLERSRYFSTAKSGAERGHGLSPVESFKRTAASKNYLEDKFADELGHSPTMKSTQRGPADTKLEEYELVTFTVKERLSLVNSTLVPHSTSGEFRVLGGKGRIHKLTFSASEAPADNPYRVHVYGTTLTIYNNHQAPAYQLKFKDLHQVQDFCQHHVLTENGRQTLRIRTNRPLNTLEDRLPGTTNVVDHKVEFELLEARTQQEPILDEDSMSSRRSVISQLRPNPTSQGTGPVQQPPSFPKRRQRQYGLTQSKKSYIDQASRGGRSARASAPSWSEFIEQPSTRSTRASQGQSRDDSHQITTLTVDSSPEVSRNDREENTVEKDDGTVEKWDKPVTFKFDRQNALVEFEDLRRLNNGQYLNDNLIEFYIRFTLQRLNLPPSTVYVFNTHFYSALTNVSKGQKSNIDYKRVERWTSKIDIFSYKYLVFPVCENHHWYLVVVSNVRNIRRNLLNGESNASQGTPGGSQGSSPKEQAAATEKATEKATEVEDAPSGILLSPTATSRPRKERKRRANLRIFDPDEPIVLVLDSLGSKHPKAARCIIEYLQEEGKAKRAMDVEAMPLHHVTELPQQGNGTDCGPFALGYLEKFLQNPREFTKLAVTREMDVEVDWPEMDASEIRTRLRAILQDLAKEQREEREREKAEKKAKKLASALPEVATPSSSPPDAVPSSSAQQDPASQSRGTSPKVVVNNAKRSREADDDDPPEQPASKSPRSSEYRASDAPAAFDQPVAVESIEKGVKRARKPDEEVSEEERKSKSPRLEGGPSSPFAVAAPPRSSPGTSVEPILLE